MTTVRPSFGRTKNESPPISSGFCRAICGGSSGSGTPPPASMANRLSWPDRLEMKYNRPSASCGSRDRRTDSSDSIRSAVRPCSVARCVTTRKTLPKLGQHRLAVYADCRARIVGGGVHQRHLRGAELLQQLDALDVLRGIARRDDLLRELRVRYLGLPCRSTSAGSATDR